MKSKKDVQDLIKTIRAKTLQTQEQISIGAGWKAKTLTQMLSKGEAMDSVYDQLSLVYKEILNNSISPRVGTRLRKVEEDYDLRASLRAISEALLNLENGQTVLRAEVRGFGQYQIMKEINWDQEKFLKAMAEVGKLIGANLKADGSKGT